VRNEIPPVNILPVKTNQDLENVTVQPISNNHFQTNFIPKKVVIAYDGPLPQEEQYDLE
jgi:hypothetical protein